MATVAEIREQLLVFLAQEQSLNAFNEWLTRNTWNIHLESAEVRELAGDVELALAEHSNGILSRDELRARLAELIMSQRFNIVFAPAAPPDRPVANTSSSSVERRSFAVAA
jgi:hypothetical protein